MNRLIRFLLLALLLVLPTGCASFGKMYDKNYPSEVLPEEWLPLEKIQERPEMLAKDTVTTTIGKTVYVESLAKWFEKHPPGSVSYRATMTHEREHSRRQLKRGVLAWIAQYAYDRNFMWLEEQIGYYYTITIRRQAGEHLDTLRMANVLHGYKNLRGSMISIEDALAWLNDVVSGRWQPPSE